MGTTKGGLKNSIICLWKVGSLGLLISNFRIIVQLKCMHCEERSIHLFFLVGTTEKKR